MQLSEVLLRHIVRSVAMIAVPGFFLLGLLAGWSHGFGLLFGAVLITTSIGGLVYIVGRLLDPSAPGGVKTVLTIALVLKLTFVAGLLWLGMARWGVSGLGIVFGLGGGLAGVMVGLIQGAASVDGKRAIDETEARIREEMGDSDDESR
ncbi:MAG: hypothetical protein AAF449_08365 [Myxococcota bacterium]